MNNLYIRANLDNNEQHALTELMLSINPELVIHYTECYITHYEEVMVRGNLRDRAVFDPERVVFDYKAKRTLRAVLRKALDKLGVYEEIEVIIPTQDCVAISDGAVVVGTCHVIHDFSALLGKPDSRRPITPIPNVADYDEEYGDYGDDDMEITANDLREQELAKYLMSSEKWLWRTGGLTKAERNKALKLESEGAKQRKWV